MAQSFKLPDLGEGLTEGEVSRWLVSEGQEIAEDDPLVEIQTDKATVEIPSPYAGTVLRIVVPEGEVAPVGTVLVVIGGARRGAARVRRDDAKCQFDTRRFARACARWCSGGGKVQATPLVRRIAGELGVDLVAVTGTGPGGRITEDDVRAAADGAPAEGRREPLRGVRRLIAEHMARAHREVPPVTWVEECDFGAVPRAELLATVVKACADSLAEFPELNARLEGDDIVYLDRCDIGVAVQTDQGLVVPVVRGCRDRIRRRDPRGDRAARRGRHAPAPSRADELRGSTFTVSSAGKLAGLFQTPIVNHPEVAILSVGRIAPRAVVRDGRSSSASRGRSRSRSTTGSSTAPAPPRSASLSSAASKPAARNWTKGPGITPGPSSTRRAPPGALACYLIWARISPPGHLVECTFAYVLPVPHRGDELGRSSLLRFPVFRAEDVADADRPRDRARLRARRRAGRPGLAAVQHRNRLMPPLIAGLPKWMCACRTAPRAPSS